MTGSGGPVRILDRLPDRVAAPLRDGYRSLMSLLPTKARLPAVELQLRGCVPCWLLRLVAVALALGSAALVIVGPFGWLVVGLLAALILIRPGSPAAPVLAATLGFSLLQHSTGWEGRGPLLLLGVHACVALCLLLGATSWAARVRLGVLASPAPSFAAIQLTAQLIGVLGTLLAGRQLSWPWLPVVAIMVLLLVVLAWIPRLGVREEPPPSRIERALSPLAQRWGDE